MRNGKVAVFTRPGEPLKIIEEEITQPAPDEILVRVSIAGICGSDVHRLKGDIAVNSEAVCFGHEAVGVIEALGEEVTTDRVGEPLAKGDVLYWMPLAPCGSCSDCSGPNPLHCKNVNWPPPIGKPSGAAFRQYATLKKKCVFIRVPSGVPPENVITFGCGMPTALRGFKQLGPIGPEDDVVIQGCGPVGLACTLIASLAGARSIIVIGDGSHRLEVASSFGATCTISLSDSTTDTRLEQVKQVTSGRGASIVVEAAGVAAAFPEGFNLLRTNGRYLILGLYSGNAIVPVDIVRINNYNLKIVGSLGIDVESFRETVEIASKHGSRLQFEKFITHRFPLERLEEALGLVGQGTPIKAVVIPN
jgi:5-exo-hydroxycamphor dehydrogenase